jgi:UDP-2,3-diacylglucosamine pyrophosphatase LpxH
MQLCGSANNYKCITFVLIILRTCMFSLMVCIERYRFRFIRSYWKEEEKTGLKLISNFDVNLPQTVISLVAYIFFTAVMCGCLARGKMQMCAERQGVKCQSRTCS